MTRPTRDELLESFRRKVSTGRPIIGGGAGIGLSAKCAETAGLDFIVIYNSGRYRMAGRSSMAGLMPYGDANAIVLEMGEEILEVVDHLPVLAGVCATDPFRSIHVSSICSRTWGSRASRTSRRCACSKA